MANEIVFRKVNLNESEKLSILAKKLWHGAYDNLKGIGKAQVDYMTEKFQSPVAISDQMQNASYEYYFIEYDKKTAGYVGIQRQENSLFLSKIYLDSAYFGKGIGQKSLLVVKKIAQDYGYKEIYLTVNKNNVRAYTAYERFGFIRTSECVTDIGGGFVMDDYIYTLKI